jgi:hypothetical protein
MIFASLYRADFIVNRLGWGCQMDLNAFQLGQ